MIKNRIGYLVLLLFCGLLFYIMGDRYFGALFFSVLLLPLFSAVYTYFGSHRVTVLQSADRVTAAKNQAITVNITLKNKGFFHCPYARPEFEAQPGVIYQSDLSRVVPLPGSRAARGTVQAVCSYRGVYPVGCSRLLLYDFLRLFCFSREVREVPVVFIYPQLYDVRLSRQMMGRGDGESPLLRTGKAEDAEVFDIRQYQMQDSVKQIHWKLSAGQEELVVKQYAALERTEAVVVLDLSPLGPPSLAAARSEEQMVETVLSLVHYYVMCSKGVELLYTGSQLNLEKVASPYEFQRIHQLGAAMRFDSGLQLYKALQIYLNSASQPLTMFLATADLSSALCEQIKSAVMAGWQIRYIDFGADGKEDVQRKNRIRGLHGSYYLPEDIC